MIFTKKCGGAIKASHHFRKKLWRTERYAFFIFKLKLYKAGEECSKYYGNEKVSGVDCIGKGLG